MAGSYTEIKKGNAANHYDHLVVENSPLCFNSKAKASCTDQHYAKGRHKLSISPV
jgi:hypothetical protein